MEVLSLLRQEDDNPRGQQGGRFVSGSNLEEAGAAEARRAEIRAQRWPLSRQEAGILHILTSKNFFQRLRVAEPRLGVEGETIWPVSAQMIDSAYSEAKKCCHPEWSFHPKKSQGFKLLNEAMDTLSDEAKRDRYVRQFVADLQSRQQLLREQEELASEGPSSSAPAISARAAAAAAAAATASELESQLAAKRRKMMQAAKLARQRESSRAGKTTAEESATLDRPLRAQLSETVSRNSAGHAGEEESDEDVSSGQSSVPRKANQLKKRRRAGMF